MISKQLNKYKIGELVTNLPEVGSLLISEAKQIDMDLDDALNTIKKLIDQRNELIMELKENWTMQEIKSAKLKTMVIE